MANQSSNDVRKRAGAELSAVIERLARDPGRNTQLTLGELRAELQREGVEWSGSGELLYPQDRTSRLIELDELIALYGEQAPALDVAASTAPSAARGV